MFYNERCVGLGIVIYGDRFFNFMQHLSLKSRRIVWETGEDRGDGQKIAEKVRNTEMTDRELGGKYYVTL